MEKRLGIPVSFNCDRDTVFLPQSQMGFIDAIVSPLFSVVCEFFPGMSFTLDNMKINREYYKNEVDKKNNKKDEIKGDKEKEESDKDEKSESASDKEN
jgi:3',5'-cyclic-nucleotide phosphodiesterase/cAMP-specific phosphodiesterase 4/calcium/calmodulin-dependent 3',5'-cyclic nucleotide phosphodiesterase